MDEATHKKVSKILNTALMVFREKKYTRCIELLRDAAMIMIKATTTTF